MLKRLLLAALVWLCVSTSTYAMERFGGYCQKGGIKVVTQGLQSDYPFQRSFPSCRVSIYVSGTVTLATLYADNLTPTPTPLANPFTANSDGYFSFYAAAGRYDIQLMDSATSTIWSWGDTELCDPLGPNADSSCVTSHQLGNSTTVLDLSLQTGANYGQKLTAAIALCPASGCTLDGRGLSGTDVITSLVTLPPFSTWLVGDSQIQCSVAPCVKYAQGDIIRGMRGLAANVLGPGGSIIWENSVVVTAGLLAPTQPYIQEVTIENLALLNGTTIFPAVGNSFGIGLDVTDVIHSKFRDLLILGFNHGVYGAHVGGCTCDNTFDSIATLGQGTDGLLLGEDANFNTVIHLEGDYPTNGGSILHLTGGDGNSVLGVKCDNGGAATTALCVKIEGAGSFNNDIMGVVISGVYLVPYWSDTSNSLTSGAGNTLQVSNRFAELGGRFPYGHVGIPFVGASASAADQHVSIGSTSIYVDPLAAVTKFLFLWSLSTTAGTNGTGTVDMLITTSDSIGTRSCDSGAFTLSSNAILTGVCATDNVSNTVSYQTTYAAGSGGHYDLTITVIPVGFQ